MSKGFDIWFRIDFIFSIFSFGHLPRRDFVLLLLDRDNIMEIEHFCCKLEIRFKSSKFRSAVPSTRQRVPFFASNGRGSLKFSFWKTPPLLSLTTAAAKKNWFCFFHSISNTFKCLSKNSSFYVEHLSVPLP